MDVIKLIKRDHQTVKALFRRFDRADKRAEKQKLGQQIIAELSVHATIEEQLLYPMLRERDPRLKDAVLDALEEHHAAKLTLAELDKMRVDDERYDAKMHVVRDAVEMHIEEEETRLLPRLEKLFDRPQREELGRAILAARPAAPDHPHPMAPDTPPGNVVSGMLAKLADLGKDLVRKVTSEDKAEGQQRARRRIQAEATKPAPTRRRAAVQPAK